MAAALHPETCQLPWLTDVEKNRVRTDVIDEAIRLWHDCHQTDVLVGVNDLIRSSFNFLFGNYDTDRHLEVEYVNKKATIASYVKDHLASTVPHVLPLMRYLFSIPASSVSCERAFSVAGLIMTEQRAAMHSDTLTMELLVRETIRSFPSPTQFVSAAMEWSVDVQAEAIA